MKENFSIDFVGEGVETHAFSAAAVAQSLLALDGLVRKVATVVCGSHSQITVNISTSCRPASFAVDIVVDNNDEKEGRLCYQYNGKSVVAALIDTIKLGKWAYGKKVVIVSKHKEKLYIKNTVGKNLFFDKYIVTLYNQSRTASYLSRLTQTLDWDGISKIKLRQRITILAEIEKTERIFFKKEDGIVIADTENEFFIYVIRPMLNGSQTGWLFSEGDGGIEFTATVEDDDFLEGVKQNKFQFLFGTSIRAVVRTVQRKNARILTERTIVEVKAVCQPE